MQYTDTPILWTFDNNGVLQSGNGMFVNNLSLNGWTNIFYPSLHKSDPDEQWNHYYQRVLNTESFTVNKTVINSGTKTKERRSFQFQPLFNANLDLTGGSCVSNILQEEPVIPSYTFCLTETENPLIKLKESEIRLHTAMKMARLGYWQLKADGTDRYWSDEVYEIWGLSRDTFVVGFESFTNTIHPEDREAYKNKQVLYYDLIEPFEFEYRIILPDHSIKWILEKGDVLIDEDGATITFHGMVQDITTQKLLLSSIEESNKRYELATTASFDAIWDWDIIKGELYLGQGFEDLFGFQLNNLTPDINNWANNLHADDIKRVMTGIKQFLKSTDTIWTDEYKYLKTDGAVACVIDRGIVVRDENGKALRMVGAMQDVTKRKHDEEVLRTFTNDLFQRNKELQEYGYVISHNLRLPVANIMGITNLLESEKNDPVFIDECISNLHVSINRLDTIIKDLSQIISISDGSASSKKELVNLTEIISDVTNDLSDQITNAGARVHLPAAQCSIVSHKAYLYSVISNLLGNAIKYRSEKQLIITITITQTPLNIILTVSDNGTGIDLTKHGNDVFKPYRRFNNNVEGKGLGLFLVKSHVEALNGTILIDSNPDTGTKFTIELPA